MERRALVLGAAGGVGGAVSRRLLGAGWKVRALVREASASRVPPKVAPILGDALNAHDVARAADGAELIVHAVNPPGYRDWDTLVLPMIDNTIAAARANRARILLPGTVYNYGPDAFPLIAETAPQHPHTRKGAIRVELENRLRAAADGGDASVLIVRAGDFFGPDAGNNWFAQGLLKPGARPSVVYRPGKRGVGHQWAFLPDVAETMVRLLEADGLDPFATFHMEGHWDPDDTRMTDMIVRILGDPAIRVTPLPWWTLRIAALFSTTPRELMEMRYLWERPVRMVNDRLVAQLGEEPRTPLEDAVRITLAGLGCLETRTGVVAEEKEGKGQGPG